MSMIYAFLADGFEETEAIAVIDVIRRAGIPLTTVSIKDSTEVTGSHNIKVMADSKIDDVDFEKADLLFLPGGVTGTKNLGECKKLCTELKSFAQKGKRLAAICAAPSILGQLGLLEGKKATCYPGWEDKLSGAEYIPEKVITDGNISTGKGMGASIDLGLEIVSIFESKEKAQEIGKSIQYLM